MSAVAPPPSIWLHLGDCRRIGELFSADRPRNLLAGHRGEGKGGATCVPFRRAPREVRGAISKRNRHGTATTAARTVLSNAPASHILRTSFADAYVSSATTPLRVVGTVERSTLKASHFSSAACWHLAISFLFGRGYSPCRA